MSHHHTIRAAISGDIEALTGLLEILFSIEEDFSFDAEKQARGLGMLIDGGAGQVLVATVRNDLEEIVIGMCVGQVVVSTTQGSTSVIVEDVVVQDEWQGKGIGAALLEGIYNWSQTVGATRMQLLADKNNTPALEFYNKLGWKETKLICLRKMID
ncbi:MAG: GNAT family N-acetyltransferase [Desulfovibrio sp.]